MSLEENEAQAAAGATAPRVSLAEVEAAVKWTFFARGSDMLETKEGVDQSILDTLDCLTICTLITHSGFSVTGTSACISLANYNEELGREIAREEAMDKLWAFEGYARRKTLAQTTPPIGAGS